jgi:hypothetical protein
MKVVLKAGDELAKDLVMDEAVVGHLKLGTKLIYQDKIWTVDSVTFRLDAQTPPHFSHLLALVVLA